MFNVIKEMYNKLKYAFDIVALNGFFSDYDKLKLRSVSRKFRYNNNYNVDYDKLDITIHNETILSKNIYHVRVFRLTNSFYQDSLNENIKKIISADIVISTPIYRYQHYIDFLKEIIRIKPKILILNGFSKLPIKFGDETYEILYKISIMIPYIIIGSDSNHSHIGLNKGILSNFIDHQIKVDCIELRNHTINQLPLCKQLILNNCHVFRLTTVIQRKKLKYDFDLVKTTKSLTCDDISLIKAKKCIVFSFPEQSMRRFDHTHKKLSTGKCKNFYNKGKFIIYGLKENEKTNFQSHLKKRIKFEQ